MLINFKSKSAADVLMYKEHAKPLLDVLHKEPDRGVLTPEEIPGAIAALEAYIAHNQKQADGTHEQDDDESDEPNRQSSVKIPLSVRAYPLLEMLRAAHKNGGGVMWGV